MQTMRHSFKGSFLVKKHKQTHVSSYCLICLKLSHISYYYGIFLSFGCQLFVVFAAI